MRCIYINFKLHNNTQSKMACAFPDQGKPLDLVLKTQPSYLSFELPEKQ